MTRKTGAGATWNPDNLATYWIIVILLFGAVVSAGVASIEGLVHVGGWILPPQLQWTLPVAVDVFLVGTALATLSLRKRRAYKAAIGVAIVTLILVAFSSTANWLYLYSIADPTTIEGQAGPWVKASMPILLLAAVEIVAALTSTRNNREASPLNRAHADVKVLKKQIAELKKAARQREPQWIEAEA